MAAAWSTAPKHCKGCGETKPASEFYRSHLGHLSTLCKLCNAAHNREYRRTNKVKLRPKIAEYRTAHRERSRGTVAHRARQIFEGMSKRSRERGWPAPEFTAAEIRSLIADERCARTGIPFSFEAPRREQNPWAPVPDRIDSDLPYTKANVQWVCNVYNSAKKAWSDEEVLVMARALLAQHEGTEHADR